MGGESSDSSNHHQIWAKLTNATMEFEPRPPPPPPTTFYIRGDRSQIVFGTNDECTLELASGATSLTSSCPINTPSSRRLDDALNDSDRIDQLEARIAQLEMDKTE